MRGLLSLDQELRAVRRAKEPKNASRSNRSPGLNETERPWQPEIEQLRQTMREVLRAVAGLSGVELPGLAPGFQDDEAPLPRLDVRNLKERFRNDLEGFSIKTTEELTKRARERTRSALEAVQNEVGGMVDQVAAEFRENLQLPAQIEKLLEPCVEDAESRLETSISQKFEHLVAQHEHLVEEKLQGTISSVLAQISSLEETVQQIRELKAESVSQSPVEQPLAATDVEHLLAEHDRSVQGRLQEALSPVQAQISTLEQTVQQVREMKRDAVVQPPAEPSTAEVAGRIDQLAAEFREKFQDQGQIERLVEPRVGELTAKLEKSLAHKVEQLFAEQEQSAREKLQEVPGRVETQVSTFEEAEARLERSISQKVEHLVAQHEQLVQEKLQGTLNSVQTQVSTFDEAEARLEKSLSQKFEQLVARHEQLVQEKLQGTLSSVQAQIGAMEQTVQQIRDLKAESVAKLPVEQPVAVADSAAKEGEGSLNMGLNGYLDQAFSRIEWSFNNLPQTPGMRPAQGSGVAPEDQHKAIPLQDMDREARIQAALDHLGQLGSKDPYPAS